MLRSATYIPTYNIRDVNFVKNLQEGTEWFFLNKDGIYLNPRCFILVILRNTSSS